MNKFLQKIFKYLPFFLKQGVVGVLLKRDAVEIKVAETEEELEQVHRLRWEVYSAEGYIDPEDYPDQRLTDKYDQHAVSFLALKNGEPVGTTRLIRYSDLGFPTEKTFNILNSPSDIWQEKTVELSKFCVKREFRNRSISLGLLNRAIGYSKEKEINYWVMFTTQKLARLFGKGIGIPLTPLPVGPLSKEHIEKRAVVGGFDRLDFHPYILKISDLRGN